MFEETTPVLIVGAGPVGLTAALLLARQGVRSILVERHASTSIHPRAKVINTRSMEIFRLMGLEKGIRAAGAELTRSQYWLFVETLVGRELRRVPRQDLFEVSSQIGQISPTSRAMCAQNQLEPLLAKEVEKAGCTLRFNAELVSFEQEEDGVLARIREKTSGALQVIHARYLLAADGARSPIRQALGISMQGTGTLAHYANIYFRADLSKLVEDRLFSMCFVENAAVRGILAPVNNRDLWQFHARYEPSTGATFDDFTEAYCTELVRKATGLAQLDIAILSVLPWETTVRVADRFLQGRVLLAGDAVHVMPPSGGFGLNSGIHDVHNLCWKLAAVLNGSASPELLKTYEVERRPVDVFTAEQAGVRLEDREAVAQALHKKLQKVDEIIVTLGYRYDSAAVIAEDETALPVDCLDLRGRPGTRAPHVWLQHHGRRCSSLDLFDKHFVLLVGSENQDWCNTEAIRDTAASLGVSLDTYRIGRTNADLLDVDECWARAYGVQPSGVVIVRPDGFVGWRTQKVERLALQQIEAVLRRLLCCAA
jgi:putative polyketide hydroxylase